jgi:hypothetical protein
LVPGTQTPWHDPLTHAELVHAAAAPQVPSDWHVSTPFEEHCVAPGVHDPMQTPFRQA